MFGWKENHYGVQSILPRVTKDRVHRERVLYRMRGRQVYAIPVAVKDEDDPTREPQSESGGGGAEVKQFTIASEQADTVTATTGEVIAKHPHLRGHVSTRVIGAAWFQVFPAFLPGGDTEEVGVTVAAKTDVGAGGVAGVEWSMIDPRVWARTR